jgi:adenine deaminase
MSERTKTINVSLGEVTYAVDSAAGRKAGTILFKNAKVINVFTQSIDETNVLLAGRLIAGLGDYTEAQTVIDLQGQYLAPGLIDGHVHIESSLVTPGAYAAGVVPRGVTGVVCDPHEIANVAGIAGIRWLLEQSEGLPLDVWMTVPSCVPSTSMETSGATLGIPEMSALLQQPRVVGVAEIMSFPAVIAADQENLSKALLAESFRKSPEGHAPGLTGRDLQAYLATGITSDHESTTLEEGLEKLRAGIFLMIREGSVTRNLTALLPLIEPIYGDRIGFVTDDRLPHDLLALGGVDVLVRRSIQAGVDPAYAVRCASYNTARHYRLPRRGAIAPGYIADLAVIDDLKNYHAVYTYKEGQKVAEGSKLITKPEVRHVNASPVMNTVKLPKLSTESFRFNLSPVPTTSTKNNQKLTADDDQILPATKGSFDQILPATEGSFDQILPATEGSFDHILPATKGSVRCIKTIHYQVLTEEIHLTPKLEHGQVVVDIERDLLKLICVERYGKTNNVGVGLVTGFGLQAGALASTVGHDHHNLMAVGVSDSDLLVACQHLEKLGGGFVAVKDGNILAELALSIAGLVTDEPLEAVRDKLDKLEAAANSLGNKLPAPFMTLSFLGLPVIPELRLTDMGLVDVLQSKIVSFNV